MPKFRKKPIIVEAEQWFPGKKVEGVYGEDPDQWGMVFHHQDGMHYGISCPCVITIHFQVIPIVPGDWIIKESDGIHSYPCKDSEFRTIYESVL